MWKVWTYCSKLKLEKVKTLELDEATHDKIYEILYESESESDHYESSSNDSSDNNNSDRSNQCAKCTGNTCTSEQDEFFYKLQSKF